MSSPIASSLIQQKFLQLFQEIAVFFSGDRQLHDQDSQQLTLARDVAFDLVKEADSPHFYRFLVYLLGFADIEGDYPLQAIRMLCLTARLLHGEKIPTEVRQDVLTAALLADTGFRPAWLGHHGSHFENAAYQLKGLNLPWFTNGLEHLILSHHQPSEDPSPHHLLSLLAHYLGLVYGTGIEDVGQPLVSPAKAVEILMADEKPEPAGLKIFLRAISAFPLGSWVRLNSGQAALVLGPNPKNPLRPKLGLFRSQATSGARWEECDLDKKPAIHIVGELMPSPAQRALMNFPELLVPGWIRAAGTGTEQIPPPPEDLIPAGSGGPDAVVLPAIIKNTEDYRRHILQKNRSSSPAGSERPAASGSPSDNAPGAWPTSETPGGPLPSKQQLLKFYREELLKLRANWEQQVRAAEQVTTSLKTPLLDSYRRENELMSSMLDRLQAIEADVTSTDPAPASEIASAGDISLVEETAPAPAQTKTPLSTLPENPKEGLRQVREHLGVFSRQAEEDQKELQQLRSQLRDTLQHLESGEFKALPSLVAFAREWQQKLESTENTLKQSELETSALTTEWQQLHVTITALEEGPQKTLAQSWKDHIRPRMERLLQAATLTLNSHHQKLLNHRMMIERFCAEARLLAA